MNTEKSPLNIEHISEPLPHSRKEHQYQSESRRKGYVEPTISVPVDVLEATAFFQGPTAVTAIVP